jgi:hypothetical protein
MLESDRRRAAWPAHVLALVSYLLLTLLFTWPLAQNFTTAIPGDSFDGWQNYWNLWWLKLALVQRITSPLFTDILYAPTGVGLYFHTLNPLNGLASLPIQLSTGLIPAYNAVVLLSWVLGGYGMFLLARHVLGARTVAATLAAFVAGMIYTLSPFHMAHLLGHMQVMSLQWLPFYILYLLRSTAQSRGMRFGDNGICHNSEAHPAELRTPTHWVRSALLAGLFLVANGLSDWYFVLYLLLFTALYLAWEWLAGVLACFRKGGTAAAKAALALRLLWAVLRPSLLAAAVFVLLLSFWLLPMMQEARQFQFMVRPPADLYILSASVMDFFVPNRLHTLWRPDSFTWIGNQIAPISERTISIGYGALALALAAFLPAGRKKAWFWLAAALFFLLLALGPQWQAGDITLADVPAAVLDGQEVPSWTPYALLNQLVPFMRISRSVSRFALLVQLSVAVLAALGLHHVLTRLERRQSERSRPHLSLVAAATALALLGIGFEYWVAPYPLSPPDTPAYYTQLAADPDPRAVLNLPMNYDRPGYLLYQTVHNKPLTVAYISRDDPRTLTERVPVLQHLRHLGPDIIAGDPAQVAPTVFADLGVGTVILDRYKMPGGQEREYTEELAGRIFAGQTPLFADERLTVYRVAPPAAPTPYLELGPQNWGPYQAPEEAGNEVRKEGGSAQRALPGGPAAVTIRHAPGAEALQIRYHTAAEGGGILVRSLADGRVLAQLPAAASGGAAVIDVPAAPAGQDAGFTLEPIGGATAYIEQLQLQ